MCNEKNLPNNDIEREGEIKMPAVAPTKKVLPRSKKEGLSELIGKYSTKVDLNKVRDVNKNANN